MEIFKDIPEYEGLYQVSNKGNIKSIKNNVILKPFLNYRGYLQVTLSKSGKTKLFRIHRLVANTFLDNPYSKTQVNHINGNKTDNRLENLEWTTPSENMIHCYAHGLQTPKKGKNNVLSKAVLQYDLDGNLLKEWECIKDIERDIGIKKQHVSACCLNKQKKTHGYVFKFKNREECLF